jgi:hypothetical protein
MEGDAGGSRLRTRHPHGGQTVATLNDVRSALASLRHCARRDIRRAADPIGLAYAEGQAVAAEVMIGSAYGRDATAVAQAVRAIRAEAEERRAHMES